MEAAAAPAVILPSHPPPTPSPSNLHLGRGSADVQQQQSHQQTSTGSGRGHQLPQRFRAKRERIRQQQQQQQQQHQFHGIGNNNNNNKKDPSAAVGVAAGGITREEINLNNLLATARHGFPVPFPTSPPGPMTGRGGPLNFGGGTGAGGVVMFPAPNGHVVTKIGLYKEPLLPCGPPPHLHHHHHHAGSGLNLSPLAFAHHHASVKAAMQAMGQAMGMFSPGRKDMGFKFPPSPVAMETPKPPAYSAVDMHQARVHSRSESASHALGHINSRSTSTSSVDCSSLGSNGHDASLKKLMKDLHRCEVSIARYQTMLNEHCDAGLRFLHQAFITLHIGLNAREKDIARELQITRHSAGTILQRRHTTACVLRQLAERASDLEETQLHELKKQIKQFVVDKKVDEELGTTSRFIGDPDDLLPHVMSFGKVVNRRRVYTHWEGDPVAAVERSKNTGSRSSASVFSSPPSSLPTTPSHITSNENTNTATAKPTAEGPHGEQKSDDSVFDRESPPTEKASGVASPNEEEEGGGGCTSGDKLGVGEPKEGPSGEQTEVVEGERSGDHSEDPPNGTNCPGGHSRGTPQSSSSPSRSRGEKVAETRPQVTVDDSVDSSAPSFPPASSSSANPFNSAAVVGSNSAAATSSTGGASTKPPAPPPTAPAHKSRQPFPRKFATPIVVTHPRRSFPKSLPRNLDPKSTVTLLLSSSSSPCTLSEKSQQKHGKHGNKNHKLFNSSSRRQLPPSYHLLSSLTVEGEREETVISQTSSSSSSPSSLSLRLKGREKERELWRKRFSNSSLASSSSSGSSSGGVELGRRGSVSGEEGGGGRVKRSPEEMSAIQSRVRESLKAQGVFLYDPMTGAIPTDSRRGESVDSSVGRLETHPNPAKTTSSSSSSSSSAVDPKKKTPTQLRRERKKRQREREQRQKELERRSQEEEGGERQRGGRLPLLVDKMSASTSRTTSPLSSLGNHTSDTPTESLSPSLSQSPPPPPNDLVGPGAREEKSEDKLTNTGSQSRDHLSSVVEDTDTFNLTRTRDGNVDGNSTTGCETAGKNEAFPLSINADSASIEWEMSRQQGRQEGVNASPSSNSLLQHKTRLAGNTGGHHNQTSSSSSSSSPLPSLSLTPDSPAHSCHAPSPNRLPNCTSPSSDVCTELSPSVALSSHQSNDPTGLSPQSPPPPPPHSSTPYSCVLPPGGNPPACRPKNTAVCPVAGKLQREMSEDPLLIINGHEE